MRKNKSIKVGVVAAVAAGLFVPSMVNASVVGGMYVDDNIASAPSVEVSIDDKDAAELADAGFELDIDLMNEILDKQLEERPDQMPHVPVITKGEDTNKDNDPTNRYEDGRWLAIGSAAVGTQDSLPDMPLTEGAQYQRFGLADPALASIYGLPGAGNVSLETHKESYGDESYRSVAVPARSAWDAGAYDDEASYAGGKDADMGWFLDNYVGADRDKHLEEGGAEFPETNAAVVYDNDDAGFWVQGLQNVGAVTGQDDNYSTSFNQVTTDPVWIDVDSTFGYETPVEGKNWDKGGEDFVGGKDTYDLVLAEERSRPSADSTWNERGERSTLPEDTALNFTGGGTDEDLVLHFNGALMASLDTEKKNTSRGERFFFNLYLKDGLTAESVGVEHNVGYWLKQYGDVHIFAIPTYNSIDNMISFEMIALDGDSHDMDAPLAFPRVSMEPSLGTGSGAGTVLMNTYHMGGYELVKTTEETGSSELSVGTPIWHGC